MQRFLAGRANFVARADILVTSWTAKFHACCFNRNVVVALKGPNLSNAKTLLRRNYVVLIEFGKNKAGK